jgi:ABC-type multidrug transport system permease subunit
VWRSPLTPARSPEFSFQRFVVVTSFMLMFVAIYFRQPLENAADVQSHILCVSFSMSLVSMFTMMTIIPFSMNRRALFYRERGAGMYHAAIYAAAAGFAELPYLFVTSLLAVNVVYWGVGFNEHASPYMYFAGLSFLYLCLMAFLGMMLAALLPEALSAQLAASAFFSIMNVFAGITVPAKLIPKPYLWLHCACRACGGGN